ncbi:MAG: hypothetical protein U9R73_00450 [Pseudomonadota bacterium]|nr:hypothetical protein [Pseudomonadota bacterium]
MRALICAALLALAACDDDQNPAPTYPPCEPGEPGCAPEETDPRTR